MSFHVLCRVLTIGRSEHRALTLVELLTVVAVVGVLTALLLAGVFTSRKKARKTQCASNLRQVGLALSMYLDDYNAFPVAANLPNSVPSEWAPIPELMSPYLTGDGKVFQCPMDNKDYFLKEGSSYEWNTLINGIAFSRKMDRPLPVLWDFERFHASGDAPQPSRNLLFANGSVQTVDF